MGSCMRSLRTVHWQAKPAAHLLHNWRNWLAEPDSLTARLQAHCVVFRVQRLAQYVGRATAEERRLLGLARAQPVWCREVLLWCDEVPVVVARTIVQQRALQRDWPFFHGLGQRSLGARLFVDPQVHRLPLRHARLSAQHPLQRWVHSTVPHAPQNLYARNSVFARRHGSMLVTEVFLPAVFDLSKRVIKTTQSGKSGKEASNATQK